MKNASWPSGRPGDTAVATSTYQGGTRGFLNLALNELTVKPDEAFELHAVGDYLHDPYDVVYLNQNSKWNLPDGMVRGLDGKVKATKPGTYMASVTIKRPDGREMSDKMRITVK